MKSPCSLCKAKTSTSCPVCVDAGDIWFCCVNCNDTVGFKQHLKSHAKKTKQYLQERSKRKKKSKNVEGDKRPPDFGNPDPKKKKPNPEYIIVNSQSSSEEVQELPLPGDSLSSEDEAGPHSSSEEEEEPADDSSFVPSGPSTPPYVPKSPVLPNPGIKKWGPNPNPNPLNFYPPPPVAKPPVLIPPPPPPVVQIPPEFQLNPEMEDPVEEEEEEEDNDVEGVPEEEIVEPFEDLEHRASYKNKPTFKTEESHEWQYQEIMNLSIRWNGKLETPIQFLTGLGQFEQVMERGLSFGPDSWLAFFGDFPTAAAMFLLRRAMPRFIVTIKGERKHPLVLNASLNELDQEVFENMGALPELNFPVIQNDQRRVQLHIFYARPVFGDKWEVADIAMWKLIARDLSQRRTRSLIRRHTTLIKSFFHYHTISFYGNMQEDQEVKRVWFGNLMKGMAKFAFENVLKNLYAVSLAASKVDFTPVTPSFVYSVLENGWIQPIFEVPIPELDYNALTPFVKFMEE